MKVYNKLVRDRIPEIIAAEGKKLKTRVLSDEEHLQVVDNQITIPAGTRRMYNKAYEAFSA